MTLGEKLKKFRNDTGMTQEELAARLYVTRAAVSKWETDRGYPAIDSLRLIARLMDCTLDELVSDDDVENRKRMEMKRAKQMYFCAIVFFAVAVVFALVAYFLKIRGGRSALFCASSATSCARSFPNRGISGSRRTAFTAPRCSSSCSSLSPSSPFSASSDKRRQNSKKLPLRCAGFFL